MSSVTLPCMLTWAGASFVKHGWEQSGQPPSCFKGNRLCFCCDSADRGVPSLIGLLGVFRVNVRIAQWAGVFPAFCKLPHSSCTAQGTPRILSCCHSNLTWCQLSMSVDFWHDSKHPRNQLRGLQVTEIAFSLWWSGMSWWQHRCNESYSHDSQQQNENKPRSLGPMVLFKSVSSYTESSSLNVLPPNSGTGIKPLMHDSRRKLNQTTVFWLKVHVCFLFCCFPPYLACWNSQLKLFSNAELTFYS